MVLGMEFLLGVYVGGYIVCFCFVIGAGGGNIFQAAVSMIAWPLFVAGYFFRK